MQLRRDDLKKAIFDAIRLSNERGIIGVTDFSILSNHLHLIVEALDRKTLSRGMQGVKIRIAKAITDLERKRPDKDDTLN